MSENAVLEARRLFRFYHAGDDETLALQGVSLGVAAGEMVSVTGPSGSGKSTLLACLAGLDEPDGGQVLVDGERLSRRPEEERARIRGSRIGMVFQQVNLVAHLSVADNVKLAQLIGTGKADGPLRARALEQAGIEHRSGHRPTQLSGGELARAAMAVAIANDPPVILADEPTGELDSTTARRVVELLRARADAGAAVLIVTHNPGLAAAADREIKLFDGRIAAAGRLTMPPADEPGWREEAESEQ